MKPYRLLCGAIIYRAIVDTVDRKLENKYMASYQKERQIEAERFLMGEDINYWMRFCDFNMSKGIIINLMWTARLHGIPKEFKYDPTGLHQVKD